MSPDLRSALAEAEAADEIIRSSQCSHDKINDYRSKKLQLVKSLLQLLEEGADPASDRELIPALKTALKACCQAAQTRVSDVSLDGCRVTAPDIAPNPLRQYCLSSYDTLKNIISGLDRMFIPPSIERNAPDARALVDLQRAYDGARQKEEKDKEINNKSFNRLFGGRG